MNSDQPKSRRWFIQDQPIELTHLRHIRAKLSASLSHRLEPESLDALLLAVTEHLTNVLKHNPSPCSVSLCLEGQPLAVVCLDRGETIESRFNGIGTIDELIDLNPLNESGMGLVLIKNLFPDAVYRTAFVNGQPQNKLTLTLKPCKKRVMIVDDDPVQLTVMEAYLSDSYQVTLFSEPSLAYDHLLKNPVDIILCDINMPEVSGIEFRQQLLALPEKSNIPFVYLTGLTDPDVQSRVNQLHIDDFIAKPVTKDRLIATLHRILNRSDHLHRNLNAQLDESITGSLWSTLPAQMGPYPLSCDYRVASRGGGDFVFSKARKNSQLIVLGDAMGHGDQAKFFTFAINGYLHGLLSAATDTLTVTEVLSALSEAMYGSDVLEKTLLTCLAIEVFDDGTIHLASAGHPAPWRLKPGGNISELTVQGSMPGLGVVEPYQRVEIRLKADETLLCFTDGLVEEVFDQKQEIDLPAIAEQLASFNPSNLVGAIMARIDAMSVLNDDVTLISIGHHRVG